MKKIIISLMALTLTLALCAASVSAEQLMGGWEIPATEASALPEAAQAAFEKATETLLGASYTPVALLATQIVAGTNYCILCQIAPVVPNPVPKWALVYIYADLEGKAEVMNVYDLDIGAFAQPAEE